MSGEKEVNMSQVCAFMDSAGFGLYQPIKRTDADADVFWCSGFPDVAEPKLGGSGFADKKKEATVRVVLAGAQGVGKTTLFNKLTGSAEETSSGIATCTRVNKTCRCPLPFNNVEVIDTPGTASEQVQYDDSYQLREAFIRKPVNLIALVAGLPSVTRMSELITVLKPMDKIMRSSTFGLDQAGLVTPSKSPHRTRVLLVLTHRDKFNLDREKWEAYVRGVQHTYPWIGSCVMIDKSVPAENLLGAVIVPASCMNSRDYNIPMTEFCSRFPISRHLSDAEDLAITEKVVEFNSGMALAMSKLREVQKEREDKGYARSSEHVDKMGPTMDCILRFMDDLYDRKTLEAVAVLEKVNVDDLWSSTDENLNLERVEKWNAIKNKMGDTYERNKLLVAQAFPTRPIDAIYKRCPYCKVVYVKPVGCDFGTHCGKTIQAPDASPFRYEYIETKSSFDIRNDLSDMGFFESAALALRKKFSKMVERNPVRFYGSEDSGGTIHESDFERGCGNAIQWDTMIPLTLEELQLAGLVPEGANYAVTPPATKGMNLPAKIRAVANALQLDSNLPPAEVMRKAYETLGVDLAHRAKSLPEQADHLYAMCVGEEE